MKTSYTKEELLGAIFKWEGYNQEYVVIENGEDDVQIQNIADGELYPNYTLSKLNKEGLLRWLVKDSLKNKIPDKWCIKCTPETYNDISKWFENELKRNPLDRDKNSYWHFPTINNCSCTMDKIQKHYKEITFEFFKKVILKESIEEDDMSYLVNILKKYNIK